MLPFRLIQFQAGKARPAHPRPPKCQAMLQQGHLLSPGIDDTPKKYGYGQRDGIEPNGSGNNDRYTTDGLSDFKRVCSVHELPFSPTARLPTCRLCLTLCGGRAHVF